MSRYAFFIIGSLFFILSGKVMANEKVTSPNTRSIVQNEDIQNEELVENVALFPFSSKEQQKRAIALAKQLRCPQCQNQNLVDSNSPIAEDLRLKIYQQVKSGKSNQEIIDFMTHRFGDFVLYKPALNYKTYVLWGLPCLLFIGFILLAIRSVNRSEVI